MCVYNAKNKNFKFRPCLAWQYGIDLTSATVKPNDVIPSKEYPYRYEFAQKSLCHAAACDLYCPFSRWIIISETFRNIPNALESFDDRSLIYAILTHGFISVMPFKVILVHEMTFLAGDSTYNDEVNRMISETFGIFRKASKTIFLRENGYFFPNIPTESIFQWVLWPVCWPLFCLRSFRIIHKCIRFYYERSAKLFLKFLGWSSLLITDKSEHEPPTGLVTLLKSLYLRNYTSELHAVFTVGWTHSIKIATKLDSLGGRPGGQRVPREGCQNYPLSYNSGMAGTIVAKFSVWL